MTPIDAVNNSVNSLDTNAKLPRYCNLGQFSLGIQGSDLAHLIGSQLGITRTLASRRPASGHHVFQVAALGAETQMIGTDAVRCIAPVHDCTFEIFKQQSVLDGICQSMDEDRTNLAAPVDLPIAVAAQGIPGPEPTACFQIADDTSMQSFEETFIHSVFYTGSN